MAKHPRTISWIAISGGGLALFLILGSWGLVSHPIGSTVRLYFYGIEASEKFDLPISMGNQNQTKIDPHGSDNLDVADEISSSNVDVIVRNTPSESSLQVPPSPKNDLIDEDTKLTDRSSTNQSNSQVPVDSRGFSERNEMKDQVSPVPVLPSDLAQENKANDVATSRNITESAEIGESKSLIDMDLENTTLDARSRDGPDLSPPRSYEPQSVSAASGCDLYNGSWFHDSSGPLYTNNSCPVLTQMQNCQGNGRPDKDYENWRWRPFQCELPRFDPKKFLELMKGKTVAFIGDSVARNQMESLLCILWQVEVPKNRGNRRMQRYYFKSTSTMIVRIWSSWLVKQTSEPLDFAPQGVTKVHLDAPDDHFMEFIPTFDVIILSSGHWFAKQSVYVLNNEIVGGQLWWPKKFRPMKVNNIQAFGISVETILTSLATHPDFTGIAIVRSYSPDHYEGGAWNTGGSCTGKEQPIPLGGLVKNEFTNIMHEQQTNGFNRAIKKVTNKSKLRFMDITKAFEYRHDGHPGPYRSPDPNKITKRGPDGRPPPQDCLHWCMPGPVDTWNELVLEIIRREFKSNESFSS